MLPGAEPDGERILDWRDVYDLDEMPEHLVVVGSGVTGAEFASGYLEAGVPVTLVSSRDQVLPGEDADAAEVLEEVFQSRGGRIAERGRAAAVTRTEKGVLVELTDGRTVEGSHALMTVGTVPNTAGLNLEQTGVEVTQAGHIVVDRVSRTSVPGIYAAGDVTGVFQLASVAAMQGRIAMWHALGEAVAPIKLKTVAANVFTHPEIATVGVQEKTITDDQDIDVVRLPLATNARAKMSDLRDGFVKLFTRRSTGVVVGGVVVAPGRLGADPADRARRHQGPDRRRPGADLLDLPVPVGLDHRGRPPADGGRRALLTGRPGVPRATAADVTDVPLNSSPIGADARGDRRWRGGCLLPGPSSAPGACCARSRWRSARVPPSCCPASAPADEPTGTTVVGRLVQAWPEAQARRRAEADGPISWVQNADGDAVRIPTEDVEGIPTGIDPAGHGRTRRTTATPRTR